VQPKLLRALESGEIERVGGGEPARADVRLVAATNRDLAAEVAAGRFREDLYYRLLVVPIQLPALRERREDVALLAAHFLAAACRRNRVRPKTLAPAALAVLAAHRWPGNVRELRNAMERVAILAPGETVHESDLAFLTGAPAAAARDAPHAPAGPFDLAAELERVERALVLAVLERTGGRMSRRARAGARAQPSVQEAQGAGHRAAGGRGRRLRAALGLPVLGAALSRPDRRSLADRKPADSPLTRDVSLVGGTGAPAPVLRRMRQGPSQPRRASPARV
jgi:transcriptional regulator with GAF, ATPase, and Fis domain